MWGRKQRTCIIRFTARGVLESVDTPFQHDTVNQVLLFKFSFMALERDSMPALRTHLCHRTSPTDFPAVIHPSFLQKVKGTKWVARTLAGKLQNIGYHQGRFWVKSCQWVTVSDQQWGRREDVTSGGSKPQRSSYRKNLEHSREPYGAKHTPTLLSGQDVPRLQQKKDASIWKGSLGRAILRSILFQWNHGGGQVEAANRKS